MAAVLVVAVLPSACSSGGQDAPQDPTPTATSGAQDASGAAPPTDATTGDPTAAALSIEGGQRPTVAWAAVDGASSYRLTVLADVGQPWAWEGTDTSVTLGGGQQDGEGLGFRLTSAAVITVTAHGADGVVLRLDQVRVEAPQG